MLKNVTKLAKKVNSHYY